MTDRVEVPETRYARTADDVCVAYQVWGQGPEDLLLLTSMVPIDLMWDEPRLRSWLERLGSFRRVICLDRRGSGSSDALSVQGTSLLEAWLDDIAAVVAAAGCDRVALAGLGEGGTSATLYAATYPERVSALILLNSYARFLRDSDYPFGLPPELLDGYVAVMREKWATAEHVKLVTPSKIADQSWGRWYARATRLSSSPTDAATFFHAIAGTNVHQVLGSIQCPTLVLHRRGNRHVRVEHGRFLAERIPGAVFHELDGDDHMFFGGDMDTLADEIEEFLTGTHSPVVTDRVLTTVLFTDIVGSSDMVARLGDQAWHKLLDAHDAVVRTQLEHFRGREVNTTGDGFLASFDGPARAIRCAMELAEELPRLGLDIRAGLHTGEVEVRGDDIGGIAVHTGARVAAMAGPREVLVSSTVKDLVAGSGIDFDDRGEHELKGVPGIWKLFAVSG